MGELKRSRTVRDACNWQRMDGDTPLEQMLNAYLTTQFILKHNVPADECLAEARKVIAIVRAYGDSGDPGAAWDELGRAEFPEPTPRPSPKQRPTGRKLG